jgi:hypothetical protein
MDKQAGVESKKKDASRASGRSSYNRTMGQHGYQDHDTSGQASAFRRAWMTNTPLVRECFETMQNSG